MTADKDLLQIVGSSDKQYHLKVLGVLRERRVLRYQDLARACELPRTSHLVRYLRPLLAGGFITKIQRQEGRSKPTLYALTSRGEVAFDGLSARPSSVLQIRQVVRALLSALSENCSLILLTERVSECGFSEGDAALLTDLMLAELLDFDVVWKRGELFSLAHFVALPDANFVPRWPSVNAVSAEVRSANVASGISALAMDQPEFDTAMLSMVAAGMGGSR